MSLSSDVQVYVVVKVIFLGDSVVFAQGSRLFDDVTVEGIFGFLQSKSNGKKYGSINENRNTSVKLYINCKFPIHRVIYLLVMIRSSKLQADE